MRRYELAMTGTVLVTGATGNTGSILVPALVDVGVDVRAFVRDKSKAKPLEDAGAEIVLGDLEEPDTIRPALEGVEKAYLLTWNGPPQAEHAHNVIEAAKEVGQPHIVRQSMWGSDNSRVVQQGNQVEEELKASGLPWTLLRPTFFMQNFLMSAQSIASEGKMYWPLEDAELAMIDIRDIVDCAVAVLTEEGHIGKTYTLSGPEAITFHEVADALSEALDKDVDYVSVPEDAALESMLSMGMNEFVAQGYIELFEGFREGFADQPTEGVPTLKGSPARSIDQFAREFAGMFQPEAA